MGALLVFDITRMSTFDAVQKWKSDIDEKVTFPGGQSIPVVLLANKVSPSYRYLGEFRNIKLLQLSLYAS